MIEEIIKLRGDGLSFRKIASLLNTTVGKVQYRFNKCLELTENEIPDQKNDDISKDTSTTENLISPDIIPLKGELKVRLVAPRKIILFWEVSEIPKNIIELFFNQNFEELISIARIYDVTEILFNGENAHHFNEIAVSYNSGHWFIKGLAENRSYIAEIGVYIAGSEFFPLYRSNCVQTHASDLSNGTAYQKDIIQVQRYEDQPPKWMEQVSTYSYYIKSNILEEPHD